MKVIDLLNKIANNEEVPNIKIGGKVYNFCTTCFANNESKELIWNFPIDTLNDEVETIEEDEEIEYKPIQELKNRRFTRNQKQIAGKINELIKAVNELKKGK